MNGFICTFCDAATQRIQVKGKLVYFDFSWRFGPLVTDREGNPLDRQPIAESDPFWPPFQRWLDTWKVANPPPPLDHDRPTATDHLDRPRR